MLSIAWEIFRAEILSEVGYRKINTIKLKTHIPTSSTVATPSQIRILKDCFFLCNMHELVKQKIERHQYCKIPDLIKKIQIKTIK